MDEFFKSQNVLNELDLDTPVYKYMPLQYVKFLIQEQKLRLFPASNWEDTYENWFLKENFQLTSGLIVNAEDLIPGVFGQCWSKKEESDAMWRIYSNVKNNGDEGFEYLQNSAVRIKTTAKKIFDAIYKDDKDMASVYIGCVNYLNQDGFDEQIDSLSPLFMRNINEVVTKSYFIKRDSFAHEEEIRPIIIVPNTGDNRFGNDFLDYSIDPNDFVEELVAEPRLKEDQYNYVREQLLNAGAREESISQSNLYQFKKTTIQLL